MCQSIVGTSGNRAVHYWLRRMRSAVSGMPLARLREAALQPQSDGTVRYTWSDMSARRILAQGLLELRMARWASARQTFGSASSKRGLALRGLSKATIIACITPAGRREWHRNTLGGSTRTWDGDNRRLERAGFYQRKRLPLQHLKPWEIGRDSGQAITRYWIPCVPSLASSTPRGVRGRARLGKLGDAIDAAKALNHADHELGWNLCDEVLTRTPRANIGQGRLGFRGSRAQAPP